MDMIEGLTFLGLESMFIALILFAMVWLGFSRLHSSIGRTRDGIPPGKVIPSWALSDLDGRLRITPASEHSQLLIFADHSLSSFPDLVSGVNQLAATVPELEVLVLSRESRELCEATVRALSLQVPIVQVDQAFYDRYRVRVMPFIYFLNPTGKVQWVGVVSAKQTLLHTWYMLQTMSTGAQL